MTLTGRARAGVIVFLALAVFGVVVWFATVRDESVGLHVAALVSLLVHSAGAIAIVASQVRRAYGSGVGGVS